LVKNLYVTLFDCMTACMSLIINPHIKQSYPQANKREFKRMNNKPNNINELEGTQEELSTKLSTGKEVKSSESLATIEPQKKCLKNEQRKRGRPRHLILATTQNDVYELSKVGTRHEDIALLLGFSEDTLTKYYRKELDKGRIEANAAVAGTLYEKAKQGDTASMLFWLKTRAGWSEKHTTELTGEGGAPINIKVVTGID